MHSLIVYLVSREYVTPSLSKERVHLLPKNNNYLEPWVWPPGRGQFWPQGHNLNNFGRGPLDDGIYQIWEIELLWRIMLQSLIAGNESDINKSKTKTTGI